LTPPVTVDQPWKVTTNLGAHDPVLIGTDGAYILIGINSANWSVAREPVSHDAERQLQDLTAAGLLPNELSDEIVRLRLCDAAWGVP
jgi:hypothetical protein